MKILKVGAPKKLGYYQIKSFQTCQFTLFSNSVISTNSLKNPGQNIYTVLGNLFHLIIEKLSKVTDEKERLELGTKLINEQSEILRKNPEFWWLEPLFTYSKTSLLLNMIVRFNPQVDTNDLEVKSNFEFDICSNDGLFYGRVDKIVYNNSKCIKIHEYKSIINSKDQDFVNTHKDQLGFYAGIINEINPDHKITGVLYSGELVPTEILFKNTEVANNLENLRNKIKLTIENSTNLVSLQTPIAANCLNCKLKPVCQSFLEIQDTFGDFEGYVFSGKLVLKTDISRFSMSLKIESELGLIVVTVPKLHPFVSKSILGKKYCFCDLKKVKNKYEFNSRTVFYEIE